MPWSPQEKSKKQEVVEVLTEPIQYKKIDLSAKFGLNIAIIGQHMRGKTLLAAMFGYFNSKYINRLDPLKFPNTIKLLKGGYMPEIEKITASANYKALRNGNASANLILDTLVRYEFIKKCK